MVLHFVLCFLNDQEALVSGPAGWLSGAHSALMGPVQPEWLQCTWGGNERLVATQPEPQVLFDAGTRGVKFENRRRGR